MTFQRTALRAAAALALGTALLPAHATNGYFPHGFGLKAKGMGGAATALAQDAFAGVNNPAASAFAGNRWDLGADIFMPDRSMNRTFNGSPIASAESDRKVFLIPEFGYNQMISDRLSWGVTVYGNGGMNTTYPATSNVLNGTGQLGVDLMQLVVAPTVAYKVNDRHSLGVSPLLVYQRFKAFGLDGFGSISSDSTKLTNNGADGSTGLGVRLGYMGRLSDAAEHRSVVFAQDRHEPLQRLRRLVRRGW